MYNSVKKFNTGIIYKMKCYFPSHVLHTLYATLLAPYLNYYILAWGNCSKLNINKIVIIKKKTIRTINFADFRSHTDGYFRTDNILKISDLYYYCLGIFLYQLNKGDLPNVFTPMFIKKQCRPFISHKPWSSDYINCVETMVKP